MSKELRLVRRSPGDHICRARFRPIQEPESNLFQTEVHVEYEIKTKLPRKSTPDQSHLRRRLVGVKARLEFTDQYKGLRRTLDFNRFFQRDNSPVEAYLHRLDHSLLLPEPMGLVKTRGKDLDLNASLYSMGDSYADALSEGFSALEMERINLKSNRLTDAGARKILSKLRADYLLELDLSYNYIGQSAIANLSQMLLAHNAALRVLKLEGLRLNDSSVEVLANGLGNCDLLQELVLARNFIGEQGAVALSSYVKNTSALQKLDLHWNQMRGDGAKRLVKSLAESEALRVLDLSWNALASPAKSNCAEALSKLFIKHQRLYHVDLSHNLFSSADCALIQKGLVSNHTVVGLHLDGNDGKVDAQGFVEKRGGSNTGSGHIFVRVLGNSKLREATMWRQISNCWICERWSEIEFTWEPGVSGLGDRDPIYLHLDIDDWRPDLMIKETDGSFKVVRMCPPGTIRYFFTHDGIVRLAQDKPKRSLHTVLNRSYVFYGTEPVSVRLTEANFIHNIPAPISLGIDNSIAVLPRPPPKAYLPITKPHEWAISGSLFRDYRFDSDDLLDKCFEFDWTCTRLPRLVNDPDELRLIKAFLKIQYKSM